MNDLAPELHHIFNSRKRYTFPFQQFKNELPLNGVYLLFEKGETFEGYDRIVRVGTHTGNKQLLARLKQHFIKENKDRSIFRKNIGRCFLNTDNKDYLPLWELDRTAKTDREQNLPLLDQAFEKSLEQRISSYIQENCSFCVFRLEEPADRIFWESRIISTLAKNHVCKPSTSWLGNNSTKQKIQDSGLWQVNELYKDSLSDDEFQQLKNILAEST